DQGEGKPTEKVLKSIKRAMPLYEVTVDDVKQLYELWGFDRVANIDRLFSDIAVDVDVLKRMLDIHRQDIRRELKAELRAALDELSNNVDLRLQKTASLERRITELSARF